jgi:predicted AlkP superfamily pyrophosphatase or phosphodiesterase
MRLIRFAAAMVGLAAAFLAPLGAAEPVAKPKLIVLAVFDQFRGDYLARWDQLFTDDGFRRLEREGTWFTNCHYPYAVTMTGPGHASLGTGCSPDRHGIITNDWYDRDAGELVYCATSDRYRIVTSLPQTEEAALAKVKKKEKGDGTPDRMLVPTFAEALKDATGGKSKVVAISLKDRSAVMPGGRKADACYWFDDRIGQFVTSTFFRERPHAWVAHFNAPRPADQWFQSSWTKSRNDIDYARYSGPDDIAAEGTGVAKKQGRVFPHPMNAGLSKPGRDYYDTVVTSPFGNDLLLDFAIRALEAENLGQGETPDFLSISFSSNDLIGHQYGPDSQEVLDVTLRSDLIVRDLLAALDRRVGKGNYLLALSADHGICPLPEVAAAEGKDAKRIGAKLFAAKAVKFMADKYGALTGTVRWIDSAAAFPWVYLNHKLIAARGLNVDEVTDTLADYFRRQDGVQAVYTRRQLEAAPSIGDEPALKMMRKSYHPGRCGDMAIVNKPYYLITPYDTGTTHGTPHAYDTHVPLVVMGPGIPVGRCDEAVAPQAVVPIFARAAGIAPPATAEATLPDRLKAK